MRLLDKLRKPGGIAAGVAWIGSARVGVRVMSVISMIVLARLLTPADFGLVAVTTAVVELLMTATDFGFTAALVHYRDAGEKEYATAWTLEAFRGLALALLLLAVAHPLAVFLGDLRLAPLLSVLALVPLIEGTENVRFIDFDKNMQFGPTFFLMTSVKLASFLVTIGLAIAWGSYWALIAGSLFAQGSRTILTYVLVPYRPRFALTGWRKLIGFSGWLAAAQLAGAISSRFNRFILAKILGADAVGIISMSGDLTIRSFREIGLPLQRVLFPGLSRLQQGSGEFRRTYLAGTSGLFIILAPVGIGLSLVASDAVPVLLGDQWQKAVLPIRLLSLTVGFWVLGSMVPPTAMAAGRTRLLFWRNFLFLFVGTAIFTIGALWYGLNGAVVGILINQVLIGTFDLFITTRVLGFRIMEQLRVFSRSLVALMVMGVCVAAVRQVLPDAVSLIEHATRLVASVVVGGIVYPLALLLLWRARGSPAGPEEKIIGMLSLWRKSWAASAH